jgi:hypothetical protein
MGELIDIRPHLDRQRFKLPLDPFDALVHAMEEVPLPELIEALTRARDVRELVGIIDELAAVIIFYTTPANDGGMS